MSALINIKNRLTRESGNINYTGFKANTSLDAFSDFNGTRGTLADPAKVAKLQVAAQAMAGDIRAALATGQLSAGEISQLQGVMEGLTGSAAAAEVYVGQMAEGVEVGIVSDGVDGANFPNMDVDGENGYNGTGSTGRIDFNRYLRGNIGAPPADMIDPHAHHILFKKGLGEAQKALVREGQALLRRYGIDPVWGLENLVWAPNRITGQHDIAALRNVVEQLKAVEKYGGTPEYIRKMLMKQLRLLAEQAASRR